MEESLQAHAMVQVKDDQQRTVTVLQIRKIQENSDQNICMTQGQTGDAQREKTELLSMNQVFSMGSWVMPLTEIKGHKERSRIAHIQAVVLGGIHMCFLG